MQRISPFTIAAELPPIHLETEVEPYRTDRRPIPQPEAHAAAQIAHVDVRDALEHIAAVHEDGAAKILPHRHPQLRVHDDDGIAALGESVCADRRRHADGVEREAPNRRVAAGKKALAGRQILDGDRLPREGCASRVRGVDGPAEAVGSAAVGERAAVATRAAAPQRPARPVMDELGMSTRASAVNALPSTGPDPRELATNRGEERQKAPVSVEKEPGRNDPCPCGSGKKYKKCHGA